ncbi:MAG: acyl-CoA dehydrogenase [Alphaproteobacteria bacterium]|nr:acyl-CoA dehydrogenase [Alphaproteobacteria bacterium]
MTQELDKLREWIGRSEVVEELSVARPIRAIFALLDKAELAKEGDPIGPMGHWCFFQPHARASEIGPDGHPKRGGFMPPVPLPRRMFGGARTTYIKPLLIGERMRREGRITDVNIKGGRTGTLVICTVKYSFYGESGLAMEEEHDIIYRDNPPPGASDGNVGKTNPAPSDYAWVRTVTPEPVMLFRYSSATFNGHRIHYDRKYVTEVEGYPGLIVHGPLTATFLLELALANNPGKSLKGFSFQARAPLFDTAPFRVAGKPAGNGEAAELWSITPEGTVGTVATANFA